MRAYMKTIEEKGRDEAEEYRLFLKREYQRMKQEGRSGRKVGGLEEVKLRLLLSLLDRPQDQSLRAANDPR